MINLSPEATRYLSLSDPLLASGESGATTRPDPPPPASAGTAAGTAATIDTSEKYDWGESIVRKDAAVGSNPLVSVSVMNASVKANYSSDDEEVEREEVKKSSTSGTHSAVRAVPSIPAKTSPHKVIAGVDKVTSVSTGVSPVDAVKKGHKLKGTTSAKPFKDASGSSMKAVKKRKVDDGGREGGEASELKKKKTEGGGSKPSKVDDIFASLFS